MSKILILLAIIAVVSSNFLPKEDETMYKFMKFVRDHSKEYATYEEFEAAFSAFKINLEKVGEAETYSPFMDKTIEQLGYLMNLKASDIPKNRAVGTKYVSTVSLGEELPESFDWREQGAVNAVKDQGQCGSCWAFSTVANLEGQYFRKTGQLLSLSEQEFVDCDDNGDEGCNGGLMDNAFEWLKRYQGLDTEGAYPYTGRRGSCKYTEAGKVADLKVLGHEDVPNDEPSIKEALFKNGPLSIAVDATVLLHYTSGISKCSFAHLNHGIALIGWGKENGVEYWIVRNSWGARWGEQGYARIPYGKGCMGMNMAVSTAILDMNLN